MKLPPPKKRHTQCPDQSAASCTLSLGTTQCQGVYDRTFVPLYKDRSVGGRTTKKLWEKERETGQLFSDEAGEFTTTCDCCSTYKEWTVGHKPLAKRLTVVASKPGYYTVFPDESVTVVQDGEHAGTINRHNSSPGRGT